MSLYLEQKFASIITSRLRNNKKVRDKYIFSCPLCGDSAKDKRKARGAILEKNGNLMFHCKNCNESMRFSTFLKRVDTGLYEEYQSERLADRYADQRSALERSDKIFKAPVVIPKKAPPIALPVAYRGLVKLSTLAPNHEAVLFVRSRFIPDFQASRLWFVEDFYAWASRVNPDRHKPRYNDMPRLVIPYVDRDGSTIGFSARALSPLDRAPKYLPVIVDPDKRMLWGLDIIAKGEQLHPDLWRKIYGVEGPIDGMFLGCALAASGGGIQNALQAAGIAKDRGVIVYDCEPRNKHIVAAMLRAASEGWSVCVWPDNTHSKDINAMVIARVKRAIDDGKTWDVDNIVSDIITIIDENTKRGMNAKLAIQEWRKC